MAAGRKPLIVRMPPKSNMDKVIGKLAQLGIIVAGGVAAVIGLYYAKLVLAPVALAVVIGLMFGPLADRIELRRIPPSVSAAIVVLLFLIVIATGLIAFAVPLSTWLDELPRVWNRFQKIVTDWSGLLSSIERIQDDMKAATGGSDKMTVEVDDGIAASDIAFLAPAIIGQIAIFLGSMYFFIANRNRIRDSVLRLCIDRRLRFRAAHIFRDAEVLVSRYLLAITAVNAGLGVAVALAMFALGVPSPILWGMLAAALNYILFIGPAFMFILLLSVGLATFSTPLAIATPAFTYLFINFIEAQFVTPSVVGRSVMMNPFVVFLTIVFWLWLWGPVGGLIAVPILLISYAVITHTLPAAPPVKAVRARAPAKKPKRPR